MSHLVDYEDAARKAKETQNPKDHAKAALCAIDVVARKNSKQLAWSWAETAIDHAEKAGIPDAEYLVEGGRYPGMEELEKCLLGLVD